MTSSGVGLLNYWYHYCIATELLALLLQVEVPRDPASNDSFSDDSFSATPNIFQVCSFLGTIFPRPDFFFGDWPSSWPSSSSTSRSNAAVMLFFKKSSLTALSRCYIFRRRGRVSSTLMPDI